MCVHHTKDYRMISGLKFKILDGLPGEVGVNTTKVSVGRGLLHHRAAKVEVTDDATSTEIEVLLDDLDELQVGLSRAGGGGAVGIHEDGKRVGKANTVGELHKGTVAEAGGDKGLGDPSGGVGGGSVDLGGVLSGEGSSSVGSPSSVCVNNNLSAGKTSITVGTTNDESARGVQVVHSLLVKVLGGDDVLDDVLHEVVADLLVGHILGVLGGDEDGVHTLGNHAAIVVLVLAGDLGLSVGAHPWEDTGLTDFGQTGTERGGKVVSKRHEGLSLIGGVSEHDSLITSTNVLELHVVDRLSDIGGLLLDGDDNVAGSVIHTLGNIIVSNITESLADNLLVVHGGRGGDLTEDHNHTGLGAGLTSHTRGRVITDAGVKDGIRDLITDLIRVSLIDRFRRKKEVLRHC